MSDHEGTAEIRTPRQPVDAVYQNKFVGVPDVIAEWVREHGGLAGRDVLDFGCGEATMALGIALRHGARRVVGVETHEEIDNCLPNARAQLGLERLPQNLELVRTGPDSSLEELGQFDVVYSWSVFEHVSQDLISDCFRKIKRVMRPHGVMFLQTTPLYYSAEGSHLKPWVPAPWAHLSMQQDLFYAALRASADSDEHANHLKWVYETLNRATAPQLLRAARQAGFEIIREYRTHDELDIPDEIKEIYTPEALTTNQLVFLARHAA
ncbi:MAG TPA: class I SAM-dependent methyltransferase [Rhodopila sp.]